jgi:hypothetical protein
MTCCLGRKILGVGSSGEESPTRFFDRVVLVILREREERASKSFEDQVPGWSYHISAVILASCDTSRHS